MSNNLKTLSPAITRAFLTRLLGQQFGGKRDLYEALGWVKEPTSEHFLEQYVRGLGKAIIDRPVNATWKRPPLIRDGDLDDSPFLSAWKTLEHRLKIWRIFKRADKLSLLGNFGGIFLGVAVGEGEPPNLSDELLEKSLSGPSDILFLSPYSDNSLTVAEYGKDIWSADFNLPVQYNLAFSSEQNGSIGSQRVHASRIVHITHDLLEDDVYGVPRLLPLLNDLFDIDKLASIAESAWRSGTTLHADVRDNFDLEPEDLQAIGQQIDEYIHGMRRVVKTTGTDLNLLGTSIPDPTGVWEMKKALLSAKTEIPPQILFGTEAHQVAGIGNESWAQYIASRQKTGVELSIVRPTIDRFIWLGILPEPSSGSYQIGQVTDDGEYRWPSIYEPSQKERSEQLAIKASTVKTLTDSGMSLFGALMFVGFSEEKAMQLMQYDLMATEQ